MNEIDIKNYIRLLYPYDEEIDKQEKKIINDFFNILKTKKLNIYDEEDYKLFKKLFTDLFNLECKLYNCKNAIIKFSNDEEEDVCSGYFDVKRIYNDKTKKYETKETIININTISALVDDFMGDELSIRLNAFYYYLKTFYHEMAHLRQFLLYSSNIYSIESLRHAKESVFADEDLPNKNELKEIYNSNHDEFGIEANSEYEGYRRLGTLMDSFFIYGIKNSSVNQITEYLSSIDFNNKSHDRDTFINKKMDTLIYFHLELLEKYPILKVEYNNDGSKKKLFELANDLYSTLSIINNLKINDKEKLIILDRIYSLYYELIVERLNSPLLGEIEELVSMTSKDSFNSLLDDINIYLFNKKRFLNNLSNRKYDIRMKLDSDFDYLKHNGFLEKVSVYNDKKEESKIDYLDYVEHEKLLDLDYKKDTEKLVYKYIIYRIPKCGYFILKNGKKILPKDLINDYLLQELDPNMDLLDVIYVLKKYVKSTAEMEYLDEHTKINSNYQRNISLIENIKETYIGKGVKL